MARRRWPSLPNGSWPNIWLVCVVLCSLLSTINIQHNATDHIPSTVRFKMYMIVEFPSSSEITIIPIEWMVGKSKTHALWSPYDSGKAGLLSTRNDLERIGSRSQSRSCTKALWAVILHPYDVLSLCIMSDMELHSMIWIKMNQIIIIIISYNVMLLM